VPRSALLAFVLGVLTSTCLAAADPLKPGEALNYVITTTTIYKPPNDKFNPLPEAEYAKLPPTRTLNSATFSVTVDRVDADGSAHAMISNLSMQGNAHGRGLSVPGLEATLMPDGQIVPKVDFAMIQAKGVDPNNPGIGIPASYRSWTQAEQANFWAFTADRRLLLFNEVALGAGKKKSFKAGDAWRIVIPDQNNQIINFTYQGMRQSNGRDVAELGFTTTRVTQNGTGPVTGTALYDLQRNILVNLHVAGDDDTPLGVRMQTLDIVLQ
jgi:hypothetical protein